MMFENRGFKVRYLRRTNPDVLISARFSESPLLLRTPSLVMKNNSGPWPWRWRRFKRHPVGDYLSLIRAIVETDAFRC